MDNTFRTQCETDLYCWQMEIRNESPVQGSFEAVLLMAHFLETGYKRAGKGLSRYEWLKKVCGFKKRQKNGTGAEDRTEQMDP